MTDLIEQVIDPGRSAIGWRWMAQEGLTASRAFPIAGGLTSTAIFTAAEAVGRRRCRRSLERLAEPGWRPLGALWVVTTSLRFVVQRDGVWDSVWLDSASGIEATADGTTILRFPSEPAYALRWVA